MKYDERHSRDKIENFLTECGLSNPLKRMQVTKAWEEYRLLMKSEKTLAYRYPKQVRVTERGGERKGNSYNPYQHYIHACFRIDIL
jgi:hypothetical protein